MTKFLRNATAQSKASTADIAIPLDRQRLLAIAAIS
jgi:hypothetical protein